MDQLKGRVELFDDFLHEKQAKNSNVEGKGGEPETKNGLAESAVHTTKTTKVVDEDEGGGEDRSVTISGNELSIYNIDISAGLRPAVGKDMGKWNLTPALSSSSPSSSPFSLFSAGEKGAQSDTKWLCCVQWYDESKDDVYAQALAPEATNCNSNPPEMKIDRAMRIFLHNDQAKSERYDRAYYSKKRCDVAIHEWNILPGNRTIRFTTHRTYRTKQFSFVFDLPDDGRSNIGPGDILQGRPAGESDNEDDTNLLLLMFIRKESETFSWEGDLNIGGSHRKPFTMDRLAKNAVSVGEFERRPQLGGGVGGDDGGGINGESSLIYDRVFYDESKGVAAKAAGGGGGVNNNCPSVLFGEAGGEFSLDVKAKPDSMAGTLLVSGLLNFPVLVVQEKPESKPMASGTWYFECQVGGTRGPGSVGWALHNFRGDTHLGAQGNVGDCHLSWGYICDFAEGSASTAGGQGTGGGSGGGGRTRSRHDGKRLDELRDFVLREQQKNPGHRQPTVAAGGGGGGGGSTNKYTYEYFLGRVKALVGAKKDPREAVVKVKKEMRKEWNKLIAESKTDSKTESLRRLDPNVLDDALGAAVNGGLRDIPGSVSDEASDAGGVIQLGSCRAGDTVGCAIDIEGQSCRFYVMRMRERWRVRIWLMVEEDGDTDGEEIEEKGRGNKSTADTVPKPKRFRRMYLSVHNNPDRPDKRDEDSFYVMLTDKFDEATTWRATTAKGDAQTGSMLTVDSTPGSFAGTAANGPLGYYLTARNPDFVTHSDGDRDCRVRCWEESEGTGAGKNQSSSYLFVHSDEAQAGLWSFPANENGARGGGAGGTSVMLESINGCPNDPAMSESDLFPFSESSLNHGNGYHWTVGCGMGASLLERDKRDEHSRYAMLYSSSLGVFEIKAREDAEKEEKKEAEEARIEMASVRRRAQSKLKQAVLLRDGQAGDEHDQSMEVEAILKQHGNPTTRKEYTLMFLKLWRQWDIPKDGLLDLGNPPSFMNEGGDDGTAATLDRTWRIAVRRRKEGVGQVEMWGIQRGGQCFLRGNKCVVPR